MLDAEVIDVLTLTLKDPSCMYTHGATDVILLRAKILEHFPNALGKIFRIIVKDEPFYKIGISENCIILVYDRDRFDIMYNDRFGVREQFEVIQDWIDNGVPVVEPIVSEPSAPLSVARVVQTILTCIVTLDVTMSCIWLSKTDDDLDYLNHLLGREEQDYVAIGFVFAR